MQSEAFEKKGPLSFLKSRLFRAIVCFVLTVAGIALAIYGADAIRKYNPAMDTGIVSTELGLGVLGIAMVVICLPVGLFAAFDMLFKPETIVLSNGHIIQRKRSRAPLITILLVLAFWASIYMTDFDLRVIVNRGYQLTAIFKKIFQPRWSYWRDIVGPLVETVKMSIMGSALGSLLSLPFAVFASTNINRNKYVVSVLRVILNIVRTLPTLVIASVCALIFKLGAFAGTVAITIFTFGVVSKMLYESIETIDMGPFEAMESMGAGRIRAFAAACMPQILPTYLSHCLYSFEMNIRAASILGYVGAGGLGILIQDRVGFRDYNSLGTLLIMLFVVVLAIDNISQALRRRLS